MDLFTETTTAYQPLASRMRPTKLTEVAGQKHILGANQLLPKLIANNQFGSIFLYGPPGSGKTTLANVIAQETGSKFVALNAVLSNVAELREVLLIARNQKERRTILFIDEIHRFNRAQQDLLLPDMEAGNIRLIGATTHNPGFYINSPLLSRSHLFRLEPLSQEEITQVLTRALSSEIGLLNTKCKASQETLESIAKLSDGDVRKALNALETIVLSQAMGSFITEDTVRIFAQERQIHYDRNEDEHYDTASAFIKSIRGSSPDAALYWLAKMIEGGEDPRFIARRLVILASEDIGLADSRALPLAMATFQACESIGLPECGINLAHAVVFLATAPKSNTAYMGLVNAQADIRKGPIQAVPHWLRDSKSKVGKILGNSADYLYSHNFPNNISGQEYMLQPKQFYFPKEVGAETAIAARIKQL